MEILGVDDKDAPEIYRGKPVSKNAVKDSIDFIQGSINKEQSSLNVLNFKNSKGQLSKAQADELLKRNSELKERKRHLKELQANQRQERIKRIEARREKEKLMQEKPEIVVVDNKEINIAPARKIARQYLEDAFVNNAEKEALLKGIPLTAKAREVIGKNLPEGFDGDKHFLERGHIFHVINDHIKTGGLTAEEYTHLPFVLLTINVCFQKRRAYNEADKIVYTKVINDKEYVVVEEIPGSKKKEKGKLLVSTMFRKEKPRSQ